MNLDSALNFNDIKTEILNIPRESPVVVYFGVGTAAHTKITPENYQQFPPFLQNMKNKIPTLTVFLVLIDPMQETPPHVAIDYKLENAAGDQYHYKNTTGSLHTFVYRASICTIADVNQSPFNINITNQLHDFNEFAIKNNITIVYHDFTGRDVALLADYFDSQAINHLDQLVYAMSARENHGCLFDLTQAHADFPFRLDESPTPDARPIIKLFNYYKFIVNESYADSLRDLNRYPREMQHLIEIQKTQIVNKITNNFKNTYLPILRIAHKEIMGGIVEQEKSANLLANQIYIFNELPQIYRQMFIELCNEKEYNLLYELMFNYTSSKLNIVARIKNMDINGEEILQFITIDEDSYKWCNNVNKFI